MSAETGQHPVDSRLRVVLCWHMHQPNYFDPYTGEYKLPWTYLHAIKDYVDMVAHLEREPQAKAVVNFAPILLEQIDDYGRQVSGYLHRSESLRDHLLASLVTPALPIQRQARETLIKACLRAHHETVIKRFPPYRRLAEMADRLVERPFELDYLNEQFLADLVTWYHLGWLGETVRREDARVKRLLEKGHDFSLHDRNELMEVIDGLLNGLLARYRRLAERGQVELSFTPYAHPIMPLLLDLTSTHDALPDAPLPLLTEYPGGDERARWHIQRGLEVFEHHFGFRPDGCWPAEGSVSDATLALLADCGLRWAATGENVLRNSLARPETPPEVRRCQCIHRPYLTAERRMPCFFRDDGLSDQIGFSYSSWHADDAVANLIGHLENIAEACQHDDDAVVSIILDGENAWEHYPENGYYFLNALYASLAHHARLRLVTFSDCLDDVQPTVQLPKVVAGSWVYGTFSTWIGEQDKNRGWDMLGEAKRVYDDVVASGNVSPEALPALERQLAVCEGSDWFWWFGDYNPGDAVSDFEQLFRVQLTTLYHMLNREPPEYLSHSFTFGGGSPAAGGTMRQGKEQF